MTEDKERLIEKETIGLIDPSEKILHTKLEDFDFANPPIDPLKLSITMYNLMEMYNGLGLSANQVGLPYRMFVMRSEPRMAVFNPRIVDYGKEQVELEEGCLSYPGLFIKVKRSKIIKVRFQGVDGNTMTRQFTGMTARIFQHEFDHMEGIDYTKKVSKLKRDMALKKAAKRSRGS